MFHYFLDSEKITFYVFINCSLTEKISKVDLERTLETQRVRLLRLVTGLLAVVALMSVVPLAGSLPRCVRLFLSDVLVRAECAVQCCVMVSARLQAGDNWAAVRAAHGCLVPMPQSASGESVLSATALIRRMKAMRRVLLDLPRHGQRFLRRLCRKNVASRAKSRPAPPRDMPVATLPQWVAPEVERPPDKGKIWPAIGFELPLLCRREAFGVGRTI